MKKKNVYVYSCGKGKLRNLKEMVRWFGLDMIQLLEISYTCIESGSRFDWLSLYIYLLSVSEDRIELFLSTTYKEDQ